MHIRAQNAALIVRRLALANFVQFEVFEVLPLTSSVMSTKGKLLRSYPGPAIQIPLDTFMDECFLHQLSSFLVQMDVDTLDSTPTISKAGSTVNEVRERVHPRYISELLVGILRGFGQPATVDRITKRIGDEVLWDDAYKPWRRSPLWLTLRVALQSSLHPNNLYKPFMLFFHAHLLRDCVRRDFPSELLYAMRIKVARRYSKLGPAVSHHVCEFVHDTSKEAEGLLSKRWATFQAAGSISRALQPDRLDFVADTEITLHKSYNYLAKMLRSVSHGFSKVSFTPSNKSRLNTLRDFSQYTNGQLTSAIAKDQCVAIADFELCVERDLESWVAASKNDDDTPNMIASCIQQYHAGAKVLYGTNAEDNSIMILTIMDLWVALDTSAIRQCPLLKQYSPEIPSSFLHPLLLHRSSTLKRALRIEEYLCQRHEEVCNATSIFSNKASESSFAVKYFRASKDLQCLNDKIIMDAEQKRAEKRAELEDLNRTSRSLLQEASMMGHGACLNPGKGKKKKCKKCRLERRAEALHISIHEWPLPHSTAHAQYVVFELSPPSAFSAWRDITYYIIRDIGLSTVPDIQGKPQVLLGSFSGLRRWTNQEGYRITIGSTTKSFSDQTHYKKVHIPANESSVLVNNGLSFRLFDQVRGSWTIESFAASNVSELCTPYIPKSSIYRHLHRFVSGAEHTPNDIIACQADCPKEITLHEFLAFSGLRSGPRLQWLNTARELASPYLSFRREEVHALITQAAWQLGPLSDGVREWHVDLGDPSFGNALLRELESLLEKIRANWLEEVTVRTIGASDISDGLTDTCLTSEKKSLRYCAI
jgi:hypothetical protein